MEYHLKTKQMYSLNNILIFFCLNFIIQKMIWKLVWECKHDLYMCIINLDIMLTKIWLPPPISQMPFEKLLFGRSDSIYDWKNVKFSCDKLIKLWYVAGRTTLKQISISSISPGVYFINVLCAHLLHKIFAPKTTKLAFGFEILAPKILYKKCTCKTLMKLTPALALVC